MTNRDLVDGLLDFGVASLMDEDGRPVAEVASPAYPSVTTDLALCPYTDVRAGGMMNRSALRQMSAVWPELMGCFSALAGPEPTVGRAWSAAVTGISLPLLAPQPVPRLTAAVFKASLGLSQVFSAMLLSADGVADAPLTALGDAAGFFAALDQGRWLVGADQVCAGPQPMIEQVFNAMTVGTSTPCPPDVLVLIRRVGTLPPEVVGLHVAHLCATQRAARVGDGEAPVATHPWLRAVFSIPNRPPEHALRLFENGKVPAGIERYLATTGVSRAELDATFERELSLMLR